MTIKKVFTGLIIQLFVSTSFAAPQLIEEQFTSSHNTCFMSVLDAMELSTETIRRLAHEWCADENGSMGTLQQGKNLSVEIINNSQEGCGGEAQVTATFRCLIDDGL